MSQANAAEPSEPAAEVDLSAARTYAQSRMIRVCLPVLFVLMLAATVFAALLPSAGLLADASDLPYVPMFAFVSGVVTLWSLLVSLSVNRRVRLDAGGITLLGLFGRRHIAWDDVKELSLGGTHLFAEKGLGTKLFVEAHDRTLISFTSRLRGVGELVELVEARTGLSFTPTRDQTLELVAPEKDEQQEP
jgi:hypothetical protein